MPIPDSLLFASDAVWTGLGGAALLVVSFVAGVAERRRARRARVDAVGWMPWTTVSFVSLFVGVILIAVAMNSR